MKVLKNIFLSFSVERRGLPDRFVALADVNELCLENRRLGASELEHRASLGFSGGGTVEDVGILGVDLHWKLKVSNQMSNFRSVYSFSKASFEYKCI